MEGYSYPYPSPYPPQLPPEDYPDRGDGFRDYYGLAPLKEDRGRRSRSQQRSRSRRQTKRNRSRTHSLTKSRSQSRSRSRSRSKSRSRSQSRSPSHARTHSRSRSHSDTRQKEFNYKEPGFLDAFRVLYLTPSKHKKNPSKFLATKKHQDRVQEFLKSDGLGSKRWYFYPRVKTCSEPAGGGGEVAGCRDNCDQRIKVDGEFFRKYKRSKKVDLDAPIAKLKWWELIFYKKLGFIESV